MKSGSPQKKDPSLVQFESDDLTYEAKKSHSSPPKWDEIEKLLPTEITWESMIH